MILYKIRFTRQYIVGMTNRLVKIRLQIVGILSEDSNEYLDFGAKFRFSF